MTTRIAFHEALRLLEDDLLAMADVVQHAIDRAVTALTDTDLSLAEVVISGDEAINESYAQIEREALELIATQQPLATDLREILAITAIATDLERIGDYAKGIAKIARRGAHPKVPTILTYIEQLSSLVRELLAQELDSFVRRDADAARAAAARDDEVDHLYELLYEEVLKVMKRDHETVTEADRLMWVAKSLERCGDHITNIGERVVFLTTGDIVELND